MLLQWMRRLKTCKLSSKCFPPPQQKNQVGIMLIKNSWNSPSLIARNVLSVFQNKWPDARLGVFSNNRTDVVPSTYFPMDLDLLNSPQLQLLDYAIVGETSPDRVSEFPLLKQVILHSKNLRILRLNIQSGPPPFDNQFELYRLCEDFGGPLNLQFQSSDICPPLQELKLPREYRLDMDHCMTWRDCMDWSCLTSLNLENRCPENFLTALSGLVPNLKYLHRALWEGKNPEEQCSNMSVVRKFLNSINGLEELYIQNYYQDIFQAVWPRIKRHCSTIQILEVHTPREYTKWPRWGMLEMDDLLERSPRLSALSIDLTLMSEDAAIGEYNRLIWVCGRNVCVRSSKTNSSQLDIQPTAKISILTRLAHLRRLCSLTLYIRIPVGIKQAIAHIVLRDALELFHEVLRVNGKSNLENLEVRAIKYMDGWFGHDTEDVITAKVTRQSSVAATHAVNRGLMGTVKQVKQGLG
jgi:hypothetical protein